MTDAYSGRKVLITGGLGFIGSNLAIELVEEGAKVTLLDNLYPFYGGNPYNVASLSSRLKIRIGDLRDEEELSKLLPETEIIFNLAGQTSHIDSMLNPLEDLDVNTKAQIVLLEACRTYCPEATILFSSTRQIYGRPEYLPVDENHPINPVDVNGISKWAGEKYHHLYAQVHGLKTSILRLTNTYGPRMRIKDARQTFLGDWIRRALEGSPIFIYGNGNQLRDFNYIDDVTLALRKLGLEKNHKGDIMNLGSNQVVNLLDLAKLLSLIEHGTTYETVTFPEDRKVIDIGDYYGDFTKIREQLNWQPSIALEQGLETTLNYFRGRLDEYT